MATAKSARPKTGLRSGNGVPSWLSDSFPKKFEKRLREARDCETLRVIAREPSAQRREDMLKECGNRYVPREEMNSAMDHYSTRVGAQHGTPRGWAPYDRTLVHVKPSYERTVYLPASWVRALHDGQWWIVVAYAPGRSSSSTYDSSHRSTSVPAHIDRVHFYKLMLMLACRDAPTGLSAHLRGVDPSPQVWVSLEGADAAYPAGLMRLDPPEAGLPVLQLTVGEPIDSAGVYIRREFRILAPGATHPVHVRQFVYRGGWPRTGIAGASLTNSNSERMHNALEFLHKVDEAHRLHPNKPILITQSANPRLEEPKRMEDANYMDNNSYTEGTNRLGTFIAALSLLRACNFGKSGRFKKLKVLSTSLSAHMRRLEFTYHTLSPLKRVFNLGSGKCDKVLQEVNNLLDQCPYILSADDGGARLPVEGGGVNRQALRMIYFMLITEASGDPRPSIIHHNPTPFAHSAASSASIGSNQAVRSFRIESESGRNAQRAASPTFNATNARRTQSVAHGTTATLRAQSHNSTASKSIGSQASSYHTARGSMPSNAAPSLAHSAERHTNANTRGSNLSSRTNSTHVSLNREPAPGSAFIEHVPKLIVRDSRAPMTSRTPKSLGDKKKGFLPKKLLGLRKGITDRNRGHIS